MWDVLDRVFIKLQQIRQYDMSYQQDIEQNLSSADSKLTNRRENARFWLRKQIGKLVTWQCTPSFVFHRDGWWALEIL